MNDVKFVKGLEHIVGATVILGRTRVRIGKNAGIVGVPGEKDEAE